MTSLALLVNHVASMWSLGRTAETLEEPITRMKVGLKIA